MAETVPIQVEEAAAARIDELGMRREFEQMLAHAQQTAPDMRAIRVVLEYDPECPHNDPQVVIYVHRPGPPGPNDETAWDWIVWRNRTFPPQVRLQMLMEPVFGGPAAVAAAFP